MGVSKNSGFSPQIIHFNRVFSIIFTIHFGVFPYFRKHPDLQGLMSPFGGCRILSMQCWSTKKTQKRWTRKRFQAWYRTRWATILPVIHVFCCFSLLYSMLCFLFKIPIQSSSQFCMLLIANMLCLNKWEVLVVTDACRCHGTLFFRFIPYAV